MNIYIYKQYHVVLSALLHVIPVPIAASHTILFGPVVILFNSMAFGTLLGGIF